jgi:hypothetical protein
MMRDSFTLTPMAIIIDQEFLKRYGNQMLDAIGTPTKADDEK